MNTETNIQTAIAPASSLERLVMRLAEDFERKADTTETTLSKLGPEARQAVSNAMRLFSKRLRAEVAKSHNK